VFAVRKDDVSFVDRLLERGLIAGSEHARLVALVRQSRLTVRVLIPE